MQPNVPVILQTKVCVAEFIGYKVIIHTYFYVNCNVFLDVKTLFKISLRKFQL